MTKGRLEILREYRQFLESIPLVEYREKFKDVKWVEQDLCPELLPLTSIFTNYWDKQRFISFERWFDEFWKELHLNSTSADALRKFKKYYFDKDNNGWFKKGFKARMYRTWVSVLTQLDFCYVAAYVSDKQGKDIRLECNAELDRKGIDVRIGELNFQIAKISQRKEARPGTGRKKIITIPYPVYDISEYERKSRSSRVKQENQIKYRNALIAFNRYFVSLKNGFVVFGERYADLVVNHLDNVDILRAKIDKLALELSGEPTT